MFFLDLFFYIFANFMNFTNSESQLMIRQMCKDFAEKNIRPNVMLWDEAQTFPVELFHEMGKMGLMGILVPEEYGGSGLGYYEYVDAIVETARVCGSIGLSLAAHNSLCTGHILSFGNEEQKKKWSQERKGREVNWNPNHIKADKGRPKPKDFGKCRHRKVLQFDIDGNFIKEWESFKDIENELGIKNTPIWSNIKGYTKQCGGFIWKYKE
jgi:hypothetical protein